MSSPTRLHCLVRWSAAGARVFLGLLFVTGGFSKLMPFPGVMGPVSLEERLEPYDLGLYARFIAWSEALIGLLLLSRRFQTLGAIMLVPMLLNIFMVTVSMSWRGTPYVVAFFLVLNAFVLVVDYHRWKLLFSVGDGALRRAEVARPRLRVELVHYGAPLLALLGVPLYGVDPALGYGAIGLALCLLAWPRGETRGELDRELGRLLDEPESSGDPASPGAA